MSNVSPGSGYLKSAGGIFLLGGLYSLLSGLIDRSGTDVDNLVVGVLLCVAGVLMFVSVGRRR